MSHYKPFTVFHAIDEWFRAWDAAQSNSSLLCLDLRDADFCTRVSNLCSVKMTVLGTAKEFLDSFKSDPEAPEVLLAYWKCEEDSGCAMCGLSSSGPKHEECKAKMEAYWKAKKAFIDFARTHHCFFSK